ncbi:DEAD-box ATP-dependent RNA helicase 46-like protein [Drosera capensis]
MAATASAGPRYAPEDPTLPKPWRGLVDGRTGYLYFWNPETNVTQYQRPAAPSDENPVPQKSPSADINGSVNVASSQGNRLSCGHDDNDESGCVEENSEAKGSNDSRMEKMQASFRNEAKDGSEPGTDQSAGGGAIKPQCATVGAVSAGSVGGSGSSGAGAGLSTRLIDGDCSPSPFMSFDATGFPQEILKQVHQAGFSAPTPIQAQSWPIALQGRDIVAVAKTGSGKTLGYLIPGFIILKRASNDPKMGPTVLVLSPTRELATQIQDEASKFGGPSRISCTCLYGGAPKGPQLKDLDKGVDIVVATPGRLNDIVEMKRVSLHQVSYLALDEADRMLDMGFEPQIRKIVNEIPARRQTLMFTATWPKEVRRIAADLLVKPIQVNIGNVDQLVANKAIMQHVEVVSRTDKKRRLYQILQSQEPGSKIIIFCATKKMCDMIAENLNQQFGAAAIHGDKSQSDRDYVLGQFRSGRSPVLVATDVAARGLDVKDIRVVINYDFPTGIEDYVHRIGRTGRAGATGVAYPFFSEEDASYTRDLIKILEGANQRVPQEVLDLVGHGGGMGDYGRRWSSGGGGGGGNDGGRGGSGYGDRDRHGCFGSGRSNSGGHGNASFNSNSGSGWGGSNQGNDSSQNRSRSPVGAPPAGPRLSFHEMMMQQSQSQR